MLGGEHLVGDIGHRGDHIHVEFAVQPLLDDLHVEQAEESAAKAEAQRHGGFRLKGEGGVVQLQLFQRGAQLLVIGGIHRVDAGEEHRLHLLEALDGRLTGTLHMGDGVAHLHLLGRLHTGNDIAHIAGLQLLAGNAVHPQHPDLIGIVFLAGGDKLHMLPRLQRAVEDAEIGDDAPEGIEHRIENQGLQRSVLVPFRRTDVLHNGLQNQINPFACLGTRLNNLLALAAQQLHNLVLNLLRHGGRHVNLVHHRNDVQVVVNGHVEV